MSALCFTWIHRDKRNRALPNGHYMSPSLAGLFNLKDLTRFNKIATQGAPQMAVDKEANSLSRVYSYYSKFNLRLFYV